MPPTPTQPRPLTPAQATATCYGVRIRVPGERGPRLLNADKSPVFLTTDLHRAEDVAVDYAWADAKVVALDVTARVRLVIGETAGAGGEAE